MGEQSFPRAGWNARAVTESEHEMLVAPAQADGFAVYANTTDPVFADGSGMAIKFVPDLSALVSGSAWYTDNAGLSVPVDSNPGTGGVRLDRLVLRQSRTTSSGTPASTWAVTAKLLKGTPGSPTPPPPVQNRTLDGSGVWDMNVGVVTVVQNAVTITSEQFACQATFIGEPNTVGAKKWGLPFSGKVGQLHTYTDTGDIYRYAGGGSWSQIIGDTGWQNVELAPSWEVSTGFKVRKKNGNVSLTVSVRRNGTNISPATNPRIGLLEDEFIPTTRIVGNYTCTNARHSNDMYVDPNNGGIYLVGDGINNIADNSFIHASLSWAK